MKELFDFLVGLALVLIGVVFISSGNYTAATAVFVLFFGSETVMVLRQIRDKLNE